MSCPATTIPPGAEISATVSTRGSTIRLRSFYVHQTLTVARRHGPRPFLRSRLPDRRRRMGSRRDSAVMGPRHSIRPLPGIFDLDQIPPIAFAYCRKLQAALDKVDKASPTGRDGGRRGRPTMRSSCTEAAEEITANMDTGTRDSAPGHDERGCANRGRPAVSRSGVAPKTTAAGVPYESGRPIRLLLVNPRFPETFWSFRWALDRVLPQKRALNPPLGLATLAALCPAAWEVTIIDENVETVPLDPDVDIVGVCGMAIQFPRQRELLNFYRRRGYYVIAGGSYASLCPERFTDLVHSIIAGEAEYIWPVFCRDFIRGTAQPRYRETGAVDLGDSPTPRFDLLKLDKYTTVSLQFSRGCPYLCEFCDIIVMFGRKPRTKRPEQIGRELDLLRSLGVRNLFFVDDNLIGHRPKAKALLRYLADYQKRHRYAFQFGTEASLNLAGDEELLGLFRDANFAWIFIGIESPDEACLRETGKVQNLRLDILSSIRNIYRYGIDILAGFIVGFDNDTRATFDRQERFIMTAGIQVSMVGLLTALPRTPLYARLKREGRLIPEADHGDNTGVGTNVLPKRMGYVEMVEGHKALYRRLFSDKHIAARIRNKIRCLRRPVYRGGYPLPQGLAIATRLLTRGVFPGGPARWYRFFATFATSAPRVWPQVISDWIAGLAMQDYVARRFGADMRRERDMARAALAYLQNRCAPSLTRGTLTVSTTATESGARVDMRLAGFVEPKTFLLAGRRLERLLRRSAVRLTLCVDELAEGQRPHLDRLLRRLARHGDRVSLRIKETLLPALCVDSSVFHLVLEDV
jgi:radical SAM superfamily enzyme YgiQ (UPF0313 family)